MLELKLSRTTTMFQLKPVERSKPDEQDTICFELFLDQGMEELPRFQQAM